MKCEDTLIQLRIENAQLQSKCAIRGAWNGALIAVILALMLALIFGG